MTWLASNWDSIITILNTVALLLIISAFEAHK